MFTIDQYEASAGYIRDRVASLPGAPGMPETAIVLGSGLGPLADEVTGAARIPYADIPGFPRTTVASHAGVLSAGRLAGKPVFVLSGRFHYYEGFEPAEVVYYVRVLRLLGVRTLILTNAAGGVNEAFRVGDFMLITDHIKLAGVSHARGPHLPEFGGRFFDMTHAYSPRLQRAARAAAEAAGVTLREGVYFYMPGPEFETPAEIRAIRALGGDAVGMSTVMEAAAAVQCGMEVLGLSCITNQAAGLSPGAAVSDDEVNVNAGRVAASFAALVKTTLAAI